ncbi:retrovirus-related pol polyprotein from transposon TNT 1-94 [Tanacetum coccineum]
MLLASKLPLFFWAEAIATACYTQNRSIIILSHEKTEYHIINDRKYSIKHLHIFGCTCYLTRDGENLDKIKEKGDPCILVGYSTQSKGYRVYNKRTRLIVESIHLRFNEIKEMSETTSRVNKSSSPTDNSTRQDTQPSINIHPTTEPSTPTNDHAEENNDNQAEDAQFQQDEFTNPFCTPIREVAESSSRNIVRGNPSKLVQTRRQLASDPKMCMFALTVSTAEPKTIKEAMDDSAWIEAMQEELHQFDRLQVWELIDKPFGKNAKYALEILKKHGMENCHISGTPLATKPKLDADLSGKPVEQTDYRSKIRTEYQLAGMFTKALLEDRFKYLVRRIGMRCLTLTELEVLANESA